MNHAWKQSQEKVPQGISGATPAPVRIRDLGVLSDRRTGALVTRHGEIVWYCPGRFDAPSLFGRLLDEQRGGSWRIDLPEGEPTGRRYLSDTAILETRLKVLNSELPDSELVVTDFLPFGEGAPRGLCRVFSRAPRTYRLVLRPAPDYARRKAALAHDGLVVRLDQSAWLHAAHPIEVEGEAAVIQVPAGEPTWVFLGSERREAVDWEVIGRWRERTFEAWEGVTTHATYHGPYEEAVRASLRALRMLTDDETGGTIAAPTTSLPEVPGGRANWDYRYVWLRDAAMVVGALTRAGGEGVEGHRFLNFICGYAPRQGGLPLAPFLCTDGHDPPQEQELDLAGYQESRPVRIGNGARGQLQLDAYGNVLLAAKMIYERFDTREHWPVVERLADFLSERWREDDYGIWEERARRPYVAGKVLAACALEYISNHTHDAEQRDRWLSAAQDIRAWVRQHGLTSEGAYAYVAGREGVDVTAALFPVWGYCAPDAPEMLATLRVLEREYCQDHLYWRHLEGANERVEGAFLAGTFWVAQYWVMRDVKRAQVILDAALAYANDLGLLAEEADLASGEPIGNFPQTFVHAALIGAVIDLRAALSEQRSDQGERPDRCGAR